MAKRSVNVPVLVDGHPVDMGKAFESVAAADEDAQLRRPAASDHHGHRSRQSHGARTGDQQDGECRQHGTTEVSGDRPTRRRR